MKPLTLFNQNFAVAESLIQLFHLFCELKRTDVPDNLRLAVCTMWKADENTAVSSAMNDRSIVLTQARNRIPDSFLMEKGLDFLLRETTIVACTALEAFLWDSLRENALTVVKARRYSADKSLLELTFTLKDYIKLQDIEDPEEGMKQIVLDNFKRATLYDVGRISSVAETLTVKDVWQKVSEDTGISAKELRKNIGELIARRNQIAHRADRPDSEDGEKDCHGLNPISYSWVNHRIQMVRTFVSSFDDFIAKAIEELNAQIAKKHPQDSPEKPVSNLAELMQDSPDLPKNPWEVLESLLKGLDSSQTTPTTDSEDDNE